MNRRDWEAIAQRASKLFNAEKKREHLFCLETCTRDFDHQARQCLLDKRACCVSISVKRLERVIALRKKGADSSNRFAKTEKNGTIEGKHSFPNTHPNL
ncbi:MAG: hypothetical protein H7318_19345 [Oligoflexus sp.]|nr:hypothetical protein [Oligoflexus sp.]